MKTNYLFILMSIMSLTYGLNGQAATVYTSPTSIGGSVLYPLHLSATGYVNDQIIDLSLSNAELNEQVRGEYKFVGTFKPIPTALSIIATVMDDKPDGSSCASIGGDKTFGCEDGARGDSDLEYLQLISRAGPSIQIDESNEFFAVDGPGTLAVIATTLAQLPLTTLTALQISEQLQVRGDLYISQAYLKVDFVERESINAVPLPPAFWLFGFALLGIFGLSRHPSIALFSPPEIYHIPK